MNTSVAEKMETAIARPLSVLAPLIKEDLKHGDEAAQNAGMPYYEAAGEKLLEAEIHFEEKPRRKFWQWCKKTFKRSEDQLSDYMKLAGARARGISKSFKSMSDFERRHLGRNIPTSGKVRRSWTGQVDDVAERARREQARIQDEHLTKEKERKAEYQLAIRLIDIGYKVLAKELHPDKGGSKDAMSRLSRVRDRLKAHA